MKKIRIGVINWDASLTKDTYFGFYQIRSLSQKKYRSWVPFYAALLDEEHIDYSRRTVAEYERELAYAIDAGIDYFAYVWYPTEASLCHTPRSENDCTHKVHELNYARRLYEQSALTDRLSMCAIVGAHPFTDGDLQELTDAFRRPYYEKIDGRPLLYVNGGYKEELILRVRTLCSEQKIPLPYVVPLCDTPKKCEAVMPLADALSAYAARNEKDIDHYEELCRIAIEGDCMRMRTGKPIIPLFSVGWDPSPRIDRTTPWTTNAEGKTNYPTVHYAPKPTEEELVAGAAILADHIRSLSEGQFAGHVLTFAWNEFEEGGYLCPTYREDGTVDDGQVRAFQRAVRLLRFEPERT